MPYDATANLIEAARKVASELDSDDPKVIARLTRRRHILAAVLRVAIRNVEAVRKSETVGKEAA